MAGGVYWLMDPMIMSILYIWCQLNKDTIVSFWFGMRFKVFALFFHLFIPCLGYVSSMGFMWLQRHFEWRRFC